MTSAVLLRSVYKNCLLIGVNNIRVGALSCQQLKPYVSQKCFASTNTGKTDTEVNSAKLPDPDKLEHFRRGKLDADPGQLPDPDRLEHFRNKPQVPVVKTEKGLAIEDALPIGTDALPHRIWSDSELHNVEITHRDPKGFVDRAAYFTVQVMRKTFDIISGFSRGERNEYKWLRRIIFLETVAGVPGMVAAMTRHLHSLRRMQRDYGWIHTLLEEAENERMHLMTALQLKMPNRLFKWGVIGTQGVFVVMFSVWYMVSPRFCHRFVGYLEEEAVITYTKCLQDIEDGPMSHWKTMPSPEVAISYWSLPEDATMKDVILAIRADEAHHRIVNHTLASMKSTDYNPYRPGK